MTVHEVHKKLESLGDAAPHAHKTKAAAPDNQFGVKLGSLRAVAKKLKTNHELALELWARGNINAQLVASLTIKPTQLTAGEVD